MVIYNRENKVLYIPQDVVDAAIDEAAFEMGYEDGYAAGYAKASEECQNS